MSAGESDHRRGDWRPGRTLYQLHSLGASGAPTTNPDVDALEPCGRGLRVLQGWLDHVAALGMGGVLLTPLFVSSTHGYDTVDPFRIDQRLGDDDDFDAFVEAAHARDLHVILDGVFNHVGRDFGPFREVLGGGRDAATTDWFRLDLSTDPYGEGFDYRTFEGHRELVALDHHQPVVLDWAARVARHWLARGADGWRLDAAYAIPRPFVAALVDAVRRDHPDAFLFGEVIHGDYAGAVAETGLDSVTQYELHKAIWSSLNDANFFELAWALERHRLLVDDFAPVTFVGNHDVTRLATRLHDPNHVAAALSLLFTLPGVPTVYYGDELGWRGTKEDRAGGDDAIRPALPASAEPADDAAKDTQARHVELADLRRARPWLTRTRLQVDHLASRQIRIGLRADEHALCLSIDLDHAEPAAPEGWTAIATGPGFVVAEPTVG